MCVLLLRLNYSSAFGVSFKLLEYKVLRYLVRREVGQSPLAHIELVSLGAVTPWGFIISQDCAFSFVDLRDSEWNVSSCSVVSVEDKIPYLRCLY